MTLYQPYPCIWHLSSSVRNQIYLWGGNTKVGKKDSNVLERFDPLLEFWCRFSTKGIPHPGLNSGAYASSGDCLYMYGGYDIRGRYCGVLNRLDVNTCTWVLSMVLLSPEAPNASHPMRKCNCGMVLLHGDKVGVFGGYGFPMEPIQPGSRYVRSNKFTDGRGWTNEFHVFNLREGRVRNSIHTLVSWVTALGFSS